MEYGVIKMDSVMIKNIIVYYAAVEKLEQLYIEQKITKQQMQRANRYVAQNSSLQTELLDSFLR